METDVSDATLLFPDTQEETPEEVTTENTIILDETEVSISIRILQQKQYQMNKK